MTSPSRPLSEAEKLAVFRTATRALPEWFAEDIKRGMTQEELKAALESVLGIWGGYSGPGQLDVTYKGAGLKIWGGWTYPRPSDKPLFAGAATVAMARTVYGIGDPSMGQLSLF